MEDTLWSEIADAPGEIFDIPEMMDEEEDSTFNAKLNSNFDFWTMSIDSATKLFDDKIVKEFFTEDQWDLIYNFVGNALDDDEYDPEDVYTIRNKIHQLHKDSWLTKNFLLNFKNWMRNNSIRMLLFMTIMSRTIINSLLS